MSTPLPENKSFLKRPLRGFKGNLLWISLVFASAFLIVHVGNQLLGPPGKQELVHLVGDLVLGPLGVEMAVALGITLLVLAIIFVHYCFSSPVRLRRLLVVCVCGVTLVVLISSVETWRQKHLLEKYKRELEASGDKVEFAEVIPPAVPDDQNFALTPIVFTTYGSMLTRDGKLLPTGQRDTNLVSRLMMPVEAINREVPRNSLGNWQKATLTDLKPWQDYYRQLANSTNMFPVAPHPQSPALDVLLALSKYDAAIEELRQASRLPYSRFPIDYDTEPGFEILLPHLASVKNATVALQLRAIAELQNGDTEKALADIKLSMRLTESIRNEPFLIEHIVRIAMFDVVLQPIYEGLATHHWSEAQLADLDSQLATLDFLADYEFSMNGERALCLSGIEYYHRSGNYDDFNFNNKPKRHLISYLVPGAFFYGNERTVARLQQQYLLPMVDLNKRIVSPAAVQSSDMALTNELQSSSMYNVFARLLIPAASKTGKKFARAQSSLDLARVAIALERYRLAHGNYPDSLDALAPQFIDKVPHDVINGGPLKYRRTDQAFVLYSIGWNATDDGGTVGLKEDGAVDWDKGDLVWTYPAK